MAQTTDQLANGAKCIHSCISGDMQWSVVISLLCQLAGVSATNTDSLIANAKCIHSCISGDMAIAVIISLLSQILANGGTGGGGSGSVLEGIGPPTNPPSASANPAIYIDTNTGIIYYWNTTNQTWN